MTGDFYSPKQHGITAIPTKTSGSSYAPNNVTSGQVAAHPTEQIESALVQGGP